MIGSILAQVNPGNGPGPLVHPHIEYSALLPQARKYFKSWDAARRAAGIDVTHAAYGPPPRFTAEELLEAIRRWKAGGRRRRSTVPVGRVACPAPPWWATVAAD